MHRICGGQDVSGESGKTVFKTNFYLYVFTYTTKGVLGAKYQTIGIK